MGRAFARPLNLSTTMMAFDELNDLPGWLKSGLTLLLGAGAARFLAVWLESRRLEKKDYRETLLTRIRELESKIEKMNTKYINIHTELALVKDENSELRERLGMPKRADVHQEVHGEAGGTDAQPQKPV